MTKRVTTIDDNTYRQKQVITKGKNRMKIEESKT